MKRFIFLLFLIVFYSCKGQSGSSGSTKKTSTSAVETESVEDNSTTPVTIVKEVVKTETVEVPTERIVKVAYCEPKEITQLRLITSIVFERAPSGPEQTKFHVKGSTIAGILTDYLSSTQGSAYKTELDRRVISDVYRVMLNREADSGGLTNYLTSFPNDGYGILRQIAYERGGEFINNKPNDLDSEYQLVYSDEANFRDIILQMMASKALGKAIDLEVGLGSQLRTAWDSNDKNEYRKVLDLLLKSTEFATFIEAQRYKPAGCEEL